MSSPKSKVLVIGATGYLGKHIAIAAAKQRHPTFVLARPSTRAAKPDLISSFEAAGITILQGSLEDHGSLVAAIKQVDVVISTVGATQLLDQTKLIAAIKEAGCIKRFFPSEFGNDIGRANALEPVHSFFGLKLQVRKAVEEAHIPYTYVASNCFAGYFLSNLVQLGHTTPPRDKVSILGNGDVKAIFVTEEDIAAYTVKAIDDPRTLNKTLHIRPPANILTHNEIVELWEKTIGKTLHKEFVAESALLEQIKQIPFPGNVFVALLHEIFIKGGQTNFELNHHADADATALYPEVKYTAAAEYLAKFA